MADLNVMMREQAVNGLQAQLDKAVTAGDTEAARKAADDLAKLAVSTAPAAPAFVSADVWKLAETKAAWLGVDPKKSAKANEFALAMNLKRFPTAEAAADAIIKAVEDEFKPAGKPEPENEDPDEDEEDEDGDDAAKEAAAAARKAKRKTDGPGEGDNNVRSNARRASGPWTKLADAPPDIQKDIKRQADKFVSSTAPKEQREKFIASALGSHYAAHQRNKGKK